MNIFRFLTPKSEIKCLDYNSSLRQAIEKVEANRYSIIPILNSDGTYFGTVSEGDLLRALQKECDYDIFKAETILISSIERYRPYKELNIESPIEQLLSLAKDQNFIPIVDDREMFIGIVTRKSLLNYFSEQIQSEFKPFK